MTSRIAHIASDLVELLRFRYAVLLAMIGLMIVPGLWLFEEPLAAVGVLGLVVVLGTLALAWVPWPELAAEQAATRRVSSASTSFWIVGSLGFVLVVVAARYLHADWGTTGGLSSGPITGLTIALAILLWALAWILLAKRCVRVGISSTWERVEAPAVMTGAIVALSAVVAVVGLSPILDESSRPGVAISAAMVCALSLAITLIGNVASLHRVRLGVRAMLCVLAVAAASGMLAFAAVSGMASEGSPVHLWQAGLIVIGAATLSTGLVLVAGLLLLRERGTADLTLGSAEAGLVQDALTTWFVVSLFFVLPAWIDLRIDAETVATPAAVWLSIMALLLSTAAAVVWGLGNSFGHLALEARRRPAILAEGTSIPGGETTEMANDERLLILDRHLTRQAAVVGAGLVVGFALATVQALA
jgi:hypothetical protein